MVQDAGVFPIVPAEVLRQNPLQHAVALMPLAEVAAAHRNGGLQLPDGAGRLAVRVDGTESDADLACLKVCACSVLAFPPIVGLLRMLLLPVTQLLGVTGTDMRHWER